MPVKSINSKEKIFESDIDWWTILIYLILVTFGWFSIYSSSFSGEDAAAFYNPHYRYGMQFIWIMLSFIVAFSIMLFDARYFYIYANLIYFLALIFMFLTLFLGKEVNGAKSWLGIGSFNVQPVEFMKIGVSFAVARLISDYSFSVTSLKSLLLLSLIVIAPALITILQNDFGSSMVFFVLFAVLYREGLSFIPYLIVFFIASVFVLSFVTDRFVLFFIILLAMILLFSVINKDWKNGLRYLGWLTSFTIVIAIILFSLSFEDVLMKAFFLSIALSLPICYVYKKINAKSKVWRFFVTAAFLMTCTFFVDYAFDNVLRPHQQIRILNLFGVLDDPRGAGYNVAQSKIAIGSGGLTGKGFLNGTQTQYSYVPEQETDFIFCAVGEEEGFIGTSLIVVLFSILVFRLMLIGERSSDTFTRVFCYSTAFIFLFHFVVNISMTIGLFPVVGIPLPFFSYGGSSLLSFTILLFIALRLNRNSKS